MANRQQAKQQHRPGNRWALQEAKANLSALVRHTAEGPQRITVRGKDTAVVISASDFERMLGEPTGRAIVEAFARCPHDFEIERASAPASPREIDL